MIGSETDFRDEWLEGAARAFTSAYADYVEEGFSTDNSLTEDEREARLALPRAKNGTAWESVAPETPIAAYALAGELWGKLEVANGCSVYVLAVRAAIADAPCPKCNGTGVDHSKPDAECAECSGRGYNDGVDPDEFGADLAMQAMGHGVSWFDDHAKFDLKVPHVECGEGSFSEEVYKP